MTNKPQFVGEWVKLGDVATYINGYAFKPTDYASEGKPIIRIQDLTGNAYQTNRFAGILDDKYRVGWGDVLISWSASLGVYEWDAEEAWLNQHIFKVQFNKLPINKRFFIHQARYVIAESGSLAHGATMRHLTKKVFANLPFFYPSEHNQDEIARHLDGIQLQIDSAKGMLTRLDDLVKSRFVEMFGEVGQTCLLEKLIVPKTHISYGIVQPGPEGTGDMGVLRPVDIVNGRLCLDGIKKIDRRIGDSYRRTELTGSEILTVVRGATGQTVRTEMNCRGMNVTRGIAVIRYDPDLIDPDYLVGYMNSDDGQRYIADHTQGATLQQINIADLKAMPIPVPPLALQQEFAALVARVDKSRFVAQQQIEKLQMLYDSLAQEYFGD